MGGAGRSPATGSGENAEGFEALAFLERSREVASELVLGSGTSSTGVAPEQSSPAAAPSGALK